MAAGRPLNRPPLPRPPLIGAVLAGGQSRRFEGVDKASVIGPHVVGALRSAGVDPIVAVGGTPDLLGIPTIADRYPGEGPLGGVATALTYARRGWVLTVPCDVPLLRSETIERVIAAIDVERLDHAVVASVDARPVVSLACWPAAWASAAHTAIRAGERRFRHLLELGTIDLVEIEPDDVADADDQPTLDALIERHRPETNQ